MSEDKLTFQKYLDKYVPEEKDDTEDNTEDTDTETDDTDTSTEDQDVEEDTDKK